MGTDDNRLGRTGFKGNAGAKAMGIVVMKGAQAKPSTQLQDGEPWGITGRVTAAKRACSTPVNGVKRQASFASVTIQKEQQQQQQPNPARD